MRGARQVGACAIALVVFASCSLTTDLSGFSGGAEATNEASTAALDDAGGISDAPISDSLLSDVAVNIVDGCSTAGCFDMPSGFALVAFGADAKGSACPSGFAQPVDTVEGPSVGAGACTCGCTVTGQPSCATGTIAGKFDVAGSGLCDSVGGNLANTGCGTDGFLGPFATGNEHRFTPPAKTGGTCTGTTTKDATKLIIAAEGRICQATTVPKCETKVCLPSVTGEFAACIGATGDVACPSAFPKKHRLGSAASFTCGGNCSCSGVTATCKGRVKYYASTDCSGASPFFVLVDDVCHPSDAMGASFGSHVYAADPPSNVACTKGGFSPPSTPALTQPTTVCCN